jgi:hypothetical protein
MSAKSSGLGERVKAFTGRTLDAIAGKFVDSNGDLARIGELVEASYARERDLREYLAEVEAEVAKLAELKRWLATYPATDGDVSGDPELMVVQTVRRIVGES